AASTPPPHTTPSAASAGAGAPARRLRACRRAETARSRRSPLRHVGRRRRRTPACAPWSSAAAAPIARAPSPDTTSRRRTPAPRIPAEAVHRSSRRLLRPLPCVGVDPVAHRLVEVTHQDLLVIERVVPERALLESHLRAVERPAVLEAVLLEG